MHVFELWEGAEVTGENTRTHTHREEMQTENTQRPQAEESSLDVSLLLNVRRQFHPS